MRIGYYTFAAILVAMHRYVKGARSERELLGKFYAMGYAVMRSAGSGVSALGPDIVAVKDGVCLAFECKAWERNRLSIDLEAFGKIQEWERNAKSPIYVAWRMNGKGWFFIKPEEMKHGEKDYSITRKKVFEINRLLEHVVAAHQVQSVIT